MRSHMENIQLTKALGNPLVHPFLFSCLHQEPLSLKKLSFLVALTTGLSYFLSKPQGSLY